MVANNKKIRTPLKWFGGKGQNYKEILKYFPFHTRYVEVFGGGLSLLFAKKDECEFEVINDIHDELINFYKILRDPVLFFSFYRKVHWTLYSRSEFYQFRREKDIADPVERAFRFYYLARQAFSGCAAMDRTPAWSFSSNDIRAQCAGAWDNMREMLPRIHKRLSRVQIECLDFRKLLSTYTHPDILTYMDPPYSFDTTRNKRERYLHEFTEKDHQDLLDIIKERDQFIVLSGYENEQYKILLDYGWKCHTFEYKMCGVGNAAQKSKVRKPVTECVWVNPRVIRATKREMI